MLPAVQGAQNSRSGVPEVSHFSQPVRVQVGMLVHETGALEATVPAEGAAMPIAAPPAV
jgi:hypothetical protein